MTSLLRILACLVVATVLTARATDVTPAYTLNLPFAADAATPVWLGQPVTGTNPFATLDLPITPPDATASLLVTVFFQEQTGGFLRIGWQSSVTVPTENGTALPGPGEAALSSVLCDNFYEGIGMANQRSLLVSADVMKQPGTLHFQTGATTLGVTSIRMEWLESTTGLTSPAINDVVVTPASGHAVLASEVAGLPPLAQDPAWQGRVVDVPVTDAPLRIEQGLDFTIQADSAPALARIALKEAGLPWGQHLVVWINNQRAGTLLPAAPPLNDEGYGSPGANTYTGWREGTFLVPAGQFAGGQNSLLFSAEPDVTPTTTADANAPLTPLAVKDVVLQLAYPDPTATAGSSVPPSSAAAAPASTVPTSQTPITPPPAMTPAAPITPTSSTP